MIEHGGDSGFAQEARARIGIAGVAWAEEFQRYRSAEIRIACFVDDAHSACADFGCDYKMADGLTDYDFAPIAHRKADGAAMLVKFAGI